MTVYYFERGKDEFVKDFERENMTRKAARNPEAYCRRFNIAFSQIHSNAKPLKEGAGADCSRAVRIAIWASIPALHSNQYRSLRGLT